MEIFRLYRLYSVRHREMSFAATVYSVYKTRLKPEIVKARIIATQALGTILGEVERES